jgi:6-phosphogluconolactonase (cycloisomerase 2 family)
MVFRIDQKTGRLTSAATSIEVGKPVCVVFVPAGKN